MDFALKEQVAIVAAASRGIGFACALELGREGLRVAVIINLHCCKRNSIDDTWCYGFEHGALAGASLRVDISFPVAGHFHLA
jgi:NAD(P)-dependent dehydrogenase (short-subunit alcohol dehydrogenase family)